MTKPATADANATAIAHDNIDPRIHRVPEGLPVLTATVPTVCALSLYVQSAQLMQQQQARAARVARVGQDTVVLAMAAIARKRARHMCEKGEGGEEGSPGKKRRLDKDDPSRWQSKQHNKERVEMIKRLFRLPPASIYLERAQQAALQAALQAAINEESRRYWGAKSIMEYREGKGDSL